MHVPGSGTYLLDININLQVDFTTFLDGSLVVYTFTKFIELIPRETRDKNWQVLANSADIRY